MALMQVPTPLSLLGSALILSSTFMLGIFERKKDKQVEEISRRCVLLLLYGMHSGALHCCAAQRIDYAGCSDCT